jgi:hypothetical protein
LSAVSNLKKRTDRRNSLKSVSTWANPKNIFNFGKWQRDDEKTLTDTQSDRTIVRPSVCPSVLLLTRRSEIHISDIISMNPSP